MTMGGSLETSSPQTRKHSEGSNAFVTKCLLASIPLLQTLLTLGGSCSYKYGYAFLFFNYNHGFQKRSLIGELFAGSAHIGYPEAGLTHLASVVLCIILSYALFAETIAQSVEGATLIAFLLSGPAFLPHLGFMTGLLDVDLASCMLISLISIKYAPRSLAIVAVSVISAVAVSIHEAYLFLFMPSVVAAYILRYPRLDRWAGVACMTVVLTGAYTIYMLNYAHPSIAEADYFSEILSRTNIDFVLARENLLAQALHVLYSSKADQVAYVADKLTATVWILAAVTIISALPYILFLIVLLARVARDRVRAGRSRWVEVLLCASLFIPLGLVLVGHDLMRWVSAAMINVSVFVAFCYAARRDRQEPWLDMRLLNAVMAVSLLIGPLGQIAGTRILSEPSGWLADGRCSFSLRHDLYLTPHQ